MKQLDDAVGQMGMQVNVQFIGRQAATFIQYVDKWTGQGKYLPGSVGFINQIDRDGHGGLIKAHSLVLKKYLQNYSLFFSTDATDTSSSRIFGGKFGSASTVLRSRNSILKS